MTEKEFKINLFDTIKTPSPGIAFVGRHNSGKTTLIEQIISNLTTSGIDVATIKHHTHSDFDIDIPGKDSYRHKRAGASDVVISSPTKIARIRDVIEEKECTEIIDAMPGHDIVIVEGYRQSGLPIIEVMRKDNPRDCKFAENLDDLLGFGEKLVGIVSNIEKVSLFCEKNSIPLFNFTDIEAISEFLKNNFVRRKISLVIQAGGESKRMGFPKEEMKLDGEYVICSQIERFKNLVDEVVITTNNPNRLSFLKKDLSIPIRIEKDIIPNKGALSGMYTALEKSKCDWVCCIACDMIFASEHLLEQQIKIMNTGNYDAVIPVNKHGREPFHALYKKKSCLEAVKKAIDLKESKVQGFLDHGNLNIYEMEQREVKKSVPRGGCFINVNTPQDIAKYQIS